MGAVGRQADQSSALPLAVEACENSMVDAQFMQSDLQICDVVTGEARGSLFEQDALCCVPVLVGHSKGSGKAPSFQATAPRSNILMCDLLRKNIPTVSYAL